jgi:hypothetical protein
MGSWRGPAAVVVTRRNVQRRSGAGSAVAGAPGRGTAAGLVMIAMRRTVAAPGVVPQGNQQYYGHYVARYHPRVNVFGSERRYGPIDVAVYLFGMAGLAACLTLVWLAMRAVMNVGGFCAEGGPYVIDTPCPEGVPVVMILSIFGLFLFGGIMAWKGTLIGGPYAALVGLAWPALFLSLGWNFLEYAFNPPAPDYGIVWGWLIPGVLFVIMGGVPLLALLPSRRLLSGVVGDTDSQASLRQKRKRLLNDLVTTANERGWGVQDDVVTKLERLASLRSSGAITDDEFEQAKRAVLGTAS